MQDWPVKGLWVYLFGDDIYVWPGISYLSLHIGKFHWCFFSTRGSFKINLFDNSLEHRQIAQQKTRVE